MNDNKDNTPFYVGQIVIAIRESFQGFPSTYKKGDIFTITKLYKDREGLWNLAFKGRNQNFGHDCRNFSLFELRNQTIEIAKELLKEPIPETLDVVPKKVLSQTKNN